MKNVFALAAMLVLSSLTSVTLADRAPVPDASAESTTVNEGNIKNQRQCPPDTAFFKNVFPSLTNGPNEGSTPPTPFTIDGETVLMTVSWADNNTFGFDIQDGVAHRVGVTVDTNNFIYDYPGAGVSSDQNLNWYSNGRDGDDVNHLDLCLAVAVPGDIIDPLVEIIEPDVGDVVFGDVTVVTIATDNEAVSLVTASVDGTMIEVTCQLVNMMTGEYECSLDTIGLGSGNYTITVSATDTSGNTGTKSVDVVVDNSAPVVTINPPSDGDEVSGTVPVNATVIDNVAVNPNSVTASVYPVSDPSSAEGLGVGSPAGGNVYTWSWDTASLPAGLYTIEVSAADTSGNTGTGSVTVDVLKSLADCFGILGDEDFTGDPVPDGYANGCEPTVLANVQAPPDTDACNPDLAPDPNNIPAFCNISGGQLKPDPAEIAALACDACVVPGYCGDITAGEYGIPDPRMYCEGTLDLQTGECKDNLGDEARWVPVKPLVPLFVKDVAEGDPELVLGKYVYGYKGCFAASQHVRGGTLLELYPAWPAVPPTGLVFIKTHRPANVIPPDLVALCNVGQADAAQAGYQPIDKIQSVDRLEDGTPAITLAATQKCVNPPRTLSRDNGIDVSNIIETDGSDDPLAFKYQMAQMQFDALFAALDCAEPTFQRGRIKFSDVTSPINQAKAQFNNGTIAALERARDDLQDAASAIREAKWDVTAENCAGDALARTENLAWRMTDLIAAPRP